MKRLSRILLGSAIVGLLALQIPATARADLIDDPVATIFIGNDIESLEIEVPLQLDELGNFQADLGSTPFTTFTIDFLTISGNVDPMVSASFGIHNTLGADSNFVFNLTMPISPVPFPTVTGGSTNIGITDTNQNGALLSAHSSNGRDTYVALIDGASYETLVLTPLSAPAFGSNSASDSFGNPIPSQPGPAANSTIGLQYNFRLTNQDRMNASGVFVVEAPEPAAVLLVLGGLFGLALRRRAA